MYTITARNVNDAYYRGCLLMSDPTVPLQDTRGGPARVYPEPVTTRYLRPMERVLFDPYRNANPFLHLFEALWMLAGRQDVAYLAQFVARFATYSDDGDKLHGAYGYRWRWHFGFDQLERLLALLRRSPDTRRAVLAMWDPRVDLGGDSKDIPCNDLIKFSRSPTGALNMVVFCRSNDMLWGAYGSNVVHFSLLQEWLATALGWPVGWYEQVSCDFHVYEAVWQGLPKPNPDDCLYTRQAVEPFPLMTLAPEAWVDELHRLLGHGVHTEGLADPFLAHTALPMLRVHALHRAKQHDRAMETAHEILASDWRLAVRQWLGLRTAPRYI